MRIRTITMGELDASYNIPGNRLIVVFEDGTFYTILLDAVRDHTDLSMRLRMLANDIEEAGDAAPRKYN